MNCSTREYSNCSDDYIVGSLILVSCLVGFVAYTLTMLAVFLSKNCQNPFYHLLISLSISDLLSLFAWTVLSVHIFHHGRKLQMCANGWCTFILSMSWNATITHCVLLTLNRFCAIVKPRLQQILFDSGSKVLLWVFLAWTLASLSPIFFLLAPGKVHFAIDPVYIVRMTDPWTMWVAQVKDKICLSLLCILIIYCYGAILYVYRQIRSRLNAHARARCDSPTSVNEQTERRVQFRLCFQSAIICIAFGFWGIFWYIMPIPGNKWVAFFYFTYWWVFVYYMNPFIYLICDTRVREAVLHMYCNRPYTTTIKKRGSRNDLKLVELVAMVGAASGRMRGWSFTSSRLVTGSKCKASDSKDSATWIG